MPDLVLRPGWNSQPPDGIDLSQELSGTSGPGFMILPSRLNPKGIVSACNLGYEYTQTHSSTQPRQTPSEYGTVLRLVADHGGGVDDRVRALNTQKTARVVPMTTIAVWKPITYSTGKTGFFVGAGHAGSCNSQSTGEFQFGYEAGNGYRRYAVFTAMMDRWNVAVISTRPVIGSEISASVNGRAPTSYTGSTAYVGDGPLSSDSKVEFIDLEFTNYYHPNCEIAWLASLPGIYLSQAQCQQIALCPEDAFTFGFEPDDIYLWGTAGGGGSTDLNAESGSYSITGSNATLAAARSINAGSGSYSITGVNAALTSAKNIVAASGSYSITGADAELSYASSGSLNAESGAYAITGNDVTFKRTYVTNLASGSYAVTGNNATLQKGYGLNAGSGVYSVTGAANAFIYNQVLNASPGSYLITGLDAVLVYSGSTGYELSADPSDYSITGFDVTFTFGGLWTDVPAATGVWTDVTPSSDVWTDH